MLWFFFFFFQAEDGIRDAQESRGLGDVYKRQAVINGNTLEVNGKDSGIYRLRFRYDNISAGCPDTCLLYTSDAADDLLCVDLGGRRIIKKKTNTKTKQNKKYNTPKKHQHHNHIITLATPR